MRLAWVVAILFLAGCTSPPWGDWNQRVGSYTYDQAVMDMGVPKAIEKQPDGGLRAKWLIQRRGPVLVSYGIGDSSAAQGLFDSAEPVESSPATNRYLILTFGKDNRLIGWRRYSQ